MNSTITLTFILIIAWFWGCGQAKTGVPNTVREGLQGPVKSVLWQQEDLNRNKDMFPYPVETLREEFYNPSGYLKRIQYYHTPIHSEYGSFPSTSKINYYNWNGFRIEAEFFNSKNELTNSFRIHRDHEGNILFEEAFDGDNKLLKQWIFERNHEDRYDLVTLVEADGSVSGKSRWYYDAKGNYVIKGLLEFGGNQWRRLYYGNGTLFYYQQLNGSSFNQLSSVYNEMYDRSGKKQFRSRVYIDQKKHLFSEFEYEDDVHGNWIVEEMHLVTRKNGQDQRKLVRYTYRDISYYED